MNGDDNVRRRRQATGCRCRCWAFARMVVVVEEELLSVDGVQIEHRRLPTFALGVTSPQHD